MTGRTTRALCGIVALMVSGCTTPPPSLGEHFQAITQAAGATSAFSASAVRGRDGAWAQVLLGVAGAGRSDIWSRDVASGKISSVSLPNDERLSLDISTLNEERIRGLLDQLKCEDRADWRVTPTLTEAQIEVGACGRDAPKVALLGGDPLSAPPGKLDEEAVRTLWGEVTTALGTETVSSVHIATDQRTLYVEKLTGGCPQSGGVLYLRELTEGHDQPVQIVCRTPDDFIEQNPGVSLEGVGLAEVLACLPELATDGLRVTAAGCL